MPTRVAKLLKQSSARNAVASVAILTILLAASLVSPSTYRYHPREDTTPKKIFRMLQKRGLNREAAATQTAGYYEGLLDQTAIVTNTGGRSWLDWRFWFVDRGRRAETNAQYTQFRNDYLRYDLTPNVDIHDYDRRWRIVTNSVGMADKEYTQEPPANTWRIALIGASISQGAGTDFGTTYEARLEGRLNQQFAGVGFDRYEVLNFAVTGYQLTQLVDVARHRVPPFSPNLYVLELAERSVFTVWADHIAALVRNGVDLKYDFLKTIVKDAELSSNMSHALINARLAPYRVPVIRWALEEIRDQARRDDAQLVVLLVPTADDPEIQIEQFEPVKRVLAEMGVTTVDLLETFVYLDDVIAVRVSAADKHPNQQGHQMLFETLVRKIDSDERLRSLFTGGAASDASHSTRVRTNDLGHPPQETAQAHDKSFGDGSL